MATLTDAEYLARLHASQTPKSNSWFRLPSTKAGFDELLDQVMELITPQVDADVWTRDVVLMCFSEIIRTQIPRGELYTTIGFLEQTILRYIANETTVYKFQEQAFDTKLNHYEGQLRENPHNQEILDEIRKNMNHPEGKKHPGIQARLQHMLDVAMGDDVVDNVSSINKPVGICNQQWEEPEPKEPA